MIVFFNRVFRGLRIFLDKNSPPGGFRLWVTLLSLIFIGYTLFLNSEKIGDIELTKNVLFWLLTSILISLLSLVTNALAWKSLCSWLGFNSRRVNFTKLFLSTNLLKYLPGGIWHFVERIRVLKFHSGDWKAINSVILEPFLMLAAALLCVSLGGFQSGLGVLFILPVCSFSKEFREPVLGRLKILLAKKLERILLELRISSCEEKNYFGRDNYPFKALLIEILFVGLRFGGFWCCLKAFDIESSLLFLDWVAAFSLSWTIGLVVPAAPGGIGIFETCLLIRVGTLVPEAPFLVSLVSYRVVVTLADLLAACVVGMTRIFSSPLLIE